MLIMTSVRRPGTSEENPKNFPADKKVMSCIVSFYLVFY